MTLLVLRWIHLVAAATWVGGLVVMGPLVVSLRRSGVGSEQLRAGARALARVSWAAMIVAVVTGIAQAQILFPWTYPRLHAKIGLVALTCALAGVHQLTARTSSARVRGLLQGGILAASLLVVAAAVAL